MDHDTNSEDELGDDDEMLELKAEHRRLQKQSARSKAKAQELYERTALYNKVTVEWPNQQQRQQAAE